MAWRPPTISDKSRFGAFADAFADVFHAIAESAGEVWLLYERDWFGFPDPPRYVVVALSADGAVIAADELNTLPRAWTFPPNVP